MMINKVTTLTEAVKLVRQGDMVALGGMTLYRRPEERADIVGLRVNAVVEAPGGAKPTSCYPDYPLDSAEILRYVEVCNSDGFEDYLKEFLELR